MSAPEGLDGNLWSILYTRFQDPLDHLAAIDPDDPFVRQALAVREQVRRQYGEIAEAVPEGLSPQERGEWIAARALGSIAADVGGGSNP